jgi:hypothetical protein
MVMLIPLQNLVRDVAHTYGAGDWVFAIIFALAILFFSVGLLISERNKRRLQGIRDVEGKTENIHLLFLRPYFTDTRIVFLNPFYPDSFFGMSLDTVTLRPEEFVGSVLEPYIAVREFGGNPRIVGNARIHVANESWHAAVNEAIASAAVILVLPLLGKNVATGEYWGAATVWELESLTESGQLERAIVLMPPTPVWRKKNISLLWEDARRRASGFGLDLPSYDPDGGVFTVAQVQNRWKPDRTFSPKISRKLMMALALI